MLGEIIRLSGTNPITSTLKPFRDNLKGFLLWAFETTYWSKFPTSIYYVKSFHSKNGTRLQACPMKHLPGSNSIKIPSYASYFLSLCQQFKLHGY